KLKTTTLILTLAFVTTLLPISPVSQAEAGNYQTIDNVTIREYDQGAKIQWETRLAAKSQIYYGLDAHDHSTLIETSAVTKNHSATLKVLDPNTTYHYTIVALDKNNESVKKTGSFKTTGTKPQLTIYQNYFALLFDNYWKNINGLNPSLIKDDWGLDFNQTGFVGNALKVNSAKSYLQYTCDKTFNSGFGTVTAWVAFDKFDKSSTIWQTNDKRYGLAYEVGNSNDDFDKRIIGWAGGNDTENLPVVEYILDNKNWGTNEWHFIVLTWDGKFNGNVTLFIDGKRVNTNTYDDATGCSSFRIGNDYNEDGKFFSIGRIDEFILHQWAMTPYYVNQNYLVYNDQPLFEKKGDLTGQIAGYNIKYYKEGKLLKALDNKIFVITRSQKMHIADMQSLDRYQSHPIITASWEEVNQYETADEKFYAWSKYPDGTMLKTPNSNKVYWVWDNEKRWIATESAFIRYKNAWEDIITVSEAELNTFSTGKSYY
ncbi:hypothetical protein KKC16_00090, partial [Patescibacteria group bacterium]|nr:hypothetical protein [Patescibacteria group bacterium]